MGRKRGWEHNPLLFLLSVWNHSVCLRKRVKKNLLLKITPWRIRHFERGFRKEITVDTQFSFLFTPHCARTQNDGQQHRTAHPWSVNHTQSYATQRKNLTLVALLQLCSILPKGFLNDTARWRVALVKSLRLICHNSDIQMLSVTMAPCNFCENRPYVSPPFSHMLFSHGF